MKTQTTRKYIKALESNIISIGYCDIQHLLTYVDPNYYTSGVYGWNADIYMFNDCMIVTGYRPFGNIHPDYLLIREYDQKAQDILRDCTIMEDERRERMHVLLDAFLDKCLEG